MNILVTGGSGFIGLNLVEALLAKNHKVICLATDRPPPVFFDAIGEKAAANLRCVGGDVRDTDLLRSLMTEYTIRGLFPLAAVTADAGREARDPEMLFAVNVAGMIAQLRAARDSGVTRIVVPASGAIYGDSYFDRSVVDEVATPCAPHDLYGLSKFAAERVALRLAELWGLDLAVARIGGTFGPWEHPTGVRDLITPFHHVAQLAIEGEEAIFPPDIPDYCWVYSRDIASGLLHLFCSGARNVAMNVSSGLNWGNRILDFANELKRAFPAFTWRQSLDSQEWNVRFTDTRARARMNINRIGKTGWQPAYLPRRAIADYVDWLALYGRALHG